MQAVNSVAYSAHNFREKANLRWQAADEILRGAGGDLLWMWRGWPLANYIPFLLVHLLIAGTGLFLVKQEPLVKGQL